MSLRPRQRRRGQDLDVFIGGERRRRDNVRELIDLGGDVVEVLGRGGGKGLDPGV
jgi:hypothetical protein